MLATFGCAYHAATYGEGRGVAQQWNNSGTILEKEVIIIILKMF